MGVRQEPVTSVLHDNPMVEIMISIIPFVIMTFDSLDLILEFLLVHLIVACDFQVHKHLPDSFVQLTVIIDTLDVKIWVIDVSLWARWRASALDPIIVRFEFSQWFSVDIIGHARRGQAKIMTFTDL